MLLYIVPFIVLQIYGVLSNYLEVASNYRNQKLERNNIVNKGIWVRNNKDADKATSNFLFRGNAVDVDNIVQGDFNAFSDGSVPNSLYITKYVERNKRSPTYHKTRHPRKTVKSANSINSDINDKENSALEKSSVISKLKPSTVFNEYPYEIAILLGNNKQALVEAKNYSTYVINEIIRNEYENTTIVPLTETLSNMSSKMDTLVDNNKANKTYVPKRSINNFENEAVRKIEYADDINSLNNTQNDINLLAYGESNREVFAKDDKVWQAAPIPDSNRYNVRSKSDNSKILRPVTERGLIKVLSMLTNTFKKIMKQHSDIKEINKKLNSMNEDFVKNIEIVSDKFQDFETKYANLVTFNQKILEMEEKMNAKEIHFKTKERQLSKNLIEFEIQQKKFLTQQRQFYNIQKLMLAQNERINSKQNAIAKTQSEISHRQNNFARILKKAKQIYLDSKLNTPKYTAAYPKLLNKTEHQFESSDTKNTIVTEHSTTTTNKPHYTESVKINLFSVPTARRLQNQDRLLLNEKDEQPVDDLVYKYYFNNTFIETLMRNFLSGFISIGEQNNKIRNVKSKRDEAIEKTTLLLPVNKAESQDKPVLRERRWISHHSRKKWRHKNKGKYGDDTNNVDDEKMVKDTKKPLKNLLDAQSSKTLPNEGKELNLNKNDPFVIMANNFCNGIGQNQTPQVLNWCIEKALRKLQNIDIKMPPPPAPVVSITSDLKVFKPLQQPTEATVTVVSETPEPQPSTPSSLPSSSNPSTETLVTIPPGAAVMYTPLSTILAQTTQNLNLFFPDNDEIETNLKEFDLKPDTEGNVYYDGSLHASDMIKDDNNENSESDIMPGMESNSRIDHMDPDTFDAEGMRRAFLRRMKYVGMLKKITKL